MSLAQVVEAKIAEFVTARYAWEALFAKAKAEQAEIEKQASELLTLQARQHRRPSLTLYATVKRHHRDDGSTYYTATGRGLTVEGDTPEIAFDNFDHEWTQGQ